MNVNLNTSSLTDELRLWNGHHSEKKRNDTSVKENLARLLFPRRPFAKLLDTFLSFDVCNRIDRGAWFLRCELGLRADEMARHSRFEIRETSRSERSWFYFFAE